MQLDIDQLARTIGMLVLEKMSAENQARGLNKENDRLAGLLADKVVERGEANAGPGEADPRSLQPDGEGDKGP